MEILRSTWEQYFLQGAAWAASRSKDPTTKVGCLLVGTDRELLGSGYNGLPRGVADLPERMERPAKYLWTSHAEENAIAHAARHGMALKGATAFVTHCPCSRCARMLIQAGISRVVIGPGTTSMPHEEFKIAVLMFTEAGVKLVTTEQTNITDTGNGGRDQGKPGGLDPDRKDQVHGKGEPAGSGGSGSQPPPGAQEKKVAKRNR